MRVTLTIPDEMEKEIKAFAAREGIAKTDAVRRALTLLKIANQEHQKGRSLGIVADNGTELTAIGKLVGV